MRNSGPAAQEMRVLQLQQIRRDHGDTAGKMDDIPEESRDESEGEEPGYDQTEHGGKLTRVLAWRTIVDTRWNSVYYLVERFLALQPAIEQWCREHPMSPFIIQVSTARRWSICLTFQRVSFNMQNNGVIIPLRVLVLQGG